MYTLGGGIGALAWYLTSIDDFVNVKKADQCCKLVRISIIGTLKHPFCSRYNIICLHIGKIVLYYIKKYLQCCKRKMQIGII